MLDSLGDPLFNESPDQIGAIDADDLPISSDLIRDIIHWDRVYQAGLAKDCSYFGFSDPKANNLLREAINLEGQCLFERLQEELRGKYEVEYTPF